MHDDENIGAAYELATFEDEMADNGNDEKVNDMPDNESDLFQALLEIRVRLDVFEDLLAQELHQINTILEDGTDVPSRAAYTRLANIIRALESDNE